MAHVEQILLSFLHALVILLVVKHLYIASCLFPSPPSLLTVSCLPPSHILVMAT